MHAMVKEGSCCSCCRLEKKPELEKGTHTLSGTQQSATHLGAEQR